MAVQEKMDERYLAQLGKMKRPIPGQSLTNDPDNPLPFEGPPIFTKRKEATEEIFSNLIREDVYPNVIEGLLNGIPVMDMTKVILFEGFRQGKWNPDLFTLLIEPTAYMIMALAERAEVDYRIDNEVEPDPEVEKTQIEKRFETVKKSLTNPKSKVKEGVIPKEIEEEIKNLPPADSLLSKKRSRIQDTDFAGESLLAPAPTKEPEVEE